MAKVVFTQNLKRHVACPDTDATGSTVREVLEDVFASHPQIRSYVLDDQAHLRKHMAVFVDGRMIRDRAGLSDMVSDASSIFVMQSLSGG